MITVRQAGTEDIEAMAALMTALGYPTTLEELKERFSHIRLQPNHLTLVACYDDEVAGMVGASYEYFYERNGTYVRVLALVTLAAYRNKGIGHALLNAVEEWAIKRGANAIMLNCGNREERKAAHQFYQRNGFEPKSTGYFKSIKGSG